jgi:putative ABC transport system permease protein
MLVLANIRSALEQLWTNKARSLLTVLGIIIAVASTITVVSVVQGLTRYVSGFLEGMGANAIWVWPNRPAGELGRTLGRVEFDVEDALAIERQCSALGAVSPLIRRVDERLTLGRNEAIVQVEGVSSTYHAIRNFPVEVGRPFALADIERAHHVCVLGREALRKLRADEDVVGDVVILKGQRLRVIGVLREKGGLLGNNQDDVVMLPYTLALKLYPSFRRKLALTASAVTGEAVAEARSQIANVLRRRHGLSAHQPNDFNIFTQDEVLQAFTYLSLVATAVLAGIVGISLLVGGIGIMNVMLVSVTERTREIGLRKAVGARRRDILLQFLTEAVTLSLLGGGLGVALGYSLCSLASLHPQMVDIVVPWWAVLLGFGISAGTGVVFGILPAVKAALLNPIDALRHE